MTIDEAITQEKELAEEKRWLSRKFEAVDNINMCLEYSEKHEQIAEWLEKLKYIENIILRWNADWYNDEDNGIPDDEILEAIFNACTNNGFDVAIDEDIFKEGYIKAYEELESKYLEKLYQAKRNIRNKAIDDFVAKLKEHKYTCNFDWEYYDEIAEQLKAGGENE